jgi:hypothetical protein
MPRVQASPGSAKLRFLPLVCFVFLILLSRARALESMHLPTTPERSQARVDHPASSRTNDNNYYVSQQGNDTNDGSQSRPWATLGHAGKVIGPGATVHVEPGVYNEAIVTEAKGSASKRILYISDKKWGAVISPPNRPIFVWKNTGDYSDIVDFDVRGDGCIGIGLGGSFQKAQGNQVHNSAAGCNEDPKSGAGIDSYNYDAHDNDIVENFVHDVGLGDSQCGQEQKYRFVHGIYMANPGGRVSSNIVVDNCSFGIHLWHAASRIVIVNNTVLRNRSGGVIIGSGDAPCNTKGCEGADYIVVRNNIVAYNGNPKLSSYGILEEAASGGRIGSHNQYSHNLSYQNRGGDFAIGNKRCENCIQGQDPGFASLSSADFHLRKDSAARGAGTDRDLPERNFEGKPIARGTVHIGALGDARE